MSEPTAPPRPASIAPDPTIPDRMPPPPPVTAEDLRTRLHDALTREHYRRARERIEASPEDHCAAFTDVVLAELLKDPGHLPARMAEAIRDANGTPEALAWWQRHPQLIPAHVYAAAAMSVRWEDHAATLAENAQLRARAEHAEGECESRREQSEKRIRLAHDARRAAEKRLELARQALLRDGYFERPEEIGLDIAPRITERLSFAQGEIGTLTSRVHALEADGAELLTRAERAEAAIADVRADCKLMAADQPPADPEHTTWLEGSRAQATRVLNILTATTDRAELAAIERVKRYLDGIEGHCSANRMDVPSWVRSIRTALDGGE